MVTLPCHPELIVSKSVPDTVSKSEVKLSLEDIDAFFIEGFDFQVLGKVLDNDISDVVDSVRKFLKTKISANIVTKSGAKISAKSGAKISTKIGAKNEPVLVTVREVNLSRIIDLLGSGNKTRKELLQGIGLANKTENFEKYVKAFMDIGLIEWTFPDKPTSKLQKYHITEKGKKLLRQ